MEVSDAAPAPAQAVSWLIPVRDGRPWLAGAVASALAECGVHDEVIVIDDGSRDGSLAGLPGDRRLRLLRQSPSGIAAALEHGRARARGALLARLDADDEALPGRLAAQRALLAEPGVGAVGGGALLFEEPTPGAGMRRYVAWVNRQRDLHRALLIECPIFHPAATLRASAVAEVGGWRQGDFPEDYDLWLRLAGAGHRLVAVERAVVQLRDRADRLTRTDARYRRGAFRRLKQDWVARHLVAPGTRLAVWGAGKEGRPWARWAAEVGIDLVAFVDPFQVGRARRGGRVQSPEALANVELDLLLVAVAARGARAEIRGALSRVRPDLVEGARWWFVA